MSQNQNTQTEMQTEMNQADQQGNWYKVTLEPIDQEQTEQKMQQEQETQTEEQEQCEQVELEVVGQKMPIHEEQIEEEAFMSNGQETHFTLEQMMGVMDEIDRRHGFGQYATEKREQKVERKQSSFRMVCECQC